MNRIIVYVASLTAAAAIIPAVPLLLGKAADDKPAKDPKSVKIEEFVFDDVQYSDEPYKVLDISSGQVMEVPVRDYSGPNIPASRSEQNTFTSHPSDGISRRPGFLFG